MISQIKRFDSFSYLSDPFIKTNKTGYNSLKNISPLTVESFMFFSPVPILNLAEVPTGYRNRK